MKYQSCLEIYTAVNNNLAESAAFHEEMANIFDFLGFRGFKRLHEYCGLLAGCNKRGVNRYYINHHNELLPAPVIEAFKITPNEWAGKKQSSINATIKKQYVEKCFEIHLEQERKTKTYLEECAKNVLDLGYTADFNKLNDLVCIQDKKLKKVERLVNELKSTNFNEAYVMTIQCEIHDCYAEKTKAIGINIC